MLVTNQLVISGWWMFLLTPSANQEPARSPEVIEEIVRARSHGSGWLAGRLKVLSSDWPREEALIVILHSCIMVIKLMIKT